MGDKKSQMSEIKEEFPKAGETGEEPAAEPTADTSYYHDIGQPGGPEAQNEGTASQLTDEERSKAGQPRSEPGTSDLGESEDEGWGSED